MKGKKTVGEINVCYQNRKVFKDSFDFFNQAFPSKPAQL